ncbi:hypothetical protein L2E82_06213 [Cichorium intybus]|uniref:Uncharacterized protein n=1 Tax=Cichorium intybus TaxID=13427 RepID=A0ACB9HA02_CICIN|nr:hypothetical protein L2E82_06213 [Cichorium intybus]
MVLCFFIRLGVSSQIAVGIWQLAWSPSALSFDCSADCKLHTYEPSFLSIIHPSILSHLKSIHASHFLLSPL